MAKNLLQQLYDGEIYPREVITCEGPKYRELTRKIIDETEYFKKILLPEDWKRFEKLDDMKFERSSDYTFANFTYGFQLGVGLIVEALANGGKLVRNNG
ncbi:DUF6809 family protein [Pelotomaculum sp. PtaB.Bin117]|uniref:DUF6809 family protein n=1 Tax=Pelotomaculum sp. PtaB.Bin117 TaxID=1811694 RepID=UPI0009CC132B|nr:DUF6809 family protein [Pelotomaculum sp. PtaB.Bin117]OPX87135.1 MAG: hypothetical protein A4E54_01798 [Pelotomaculum sp. PtaB.Bin117]OPY62239.1 MAG: hypothetical protein A4E56_01496 [Pelotomaculum sp. PtaU1.Bin065]